MAYSASAMGPAAIVEHLRNKDQLDRNCARYEGVRALRKCTRVFLSASGSRVWHSHTISVCQPHFFNRLTFVLSRCRFRASLGTQYSWLDEGTDALLQPACWCQKHPLTNIAFCFFGNTISGFPGNSLRWSRNRKPRACSSLRTSISGTVSTDLIRDISKRRCFCPLCNTP